MSTFPMPVYADPLPSDVRAIFEDPFRLTLSEVAEYTRIPLQTINSWTRIGVEGRKLATVKIGRQLFTTRGHVDEFILASHLSRTSGHSIATLGSDSPGELTSED